MSDYQYAELKDLRWDHTGVDRESKVIRGVIIAEYGAFRSRQGAFDQAALQTISHLINSDPKGKTVYMGHPKGGNDVERPFLGVVKNARLEGDRRVRADLHFSQIAMKPMPSGGTPPGEYIMDLAEQDSRALEMSARLMYRPKRKQLDRAPLWEVKEIDGADVVRTGDATRSGLLSSDPSNGNMDQSSNLRVPELEDGTLPLDSETKSFITTAIDDRFNTLKKDVTDTISASLNAIEEKREQEKKDKETQEKLEKAELAEKASKFATRVMDVPGFKKADAVKMLEEIKSGSLAYETALEKLQDFKVKSPESEMDEGDPESANLSTEQKVDKQLKQEFKDGEQTYQAHGLSFEDYKADNVERVRAELVA